MSKSLKSRICKLENIKSQRNTNRIIIYNPADPDSKVKALRMARPGKYMLVSSYASDSEWEEALCEQQRRLLTNS